MCIRDRAGEGRDRAEPVPLRQGGIRQGAGALRAQRRHHARGAAGTAGRGTAAAARYAGRADRYHADRAPAGAHRFPRLQRLPGQRRTGGGRAGPAGRAAGSEFPPAVPVPR